MDLQVFPPVLNSRNEDSERYISNIVLLTETALAIAIQAVHLMASPEVHFASDIARKAAVDLRMLLVEVPSPLGVTAAQDLLRVLESADAQTVAAIASRSNTRQFLIWARCSAELYAVGGPCVEPSHGEEIAACARVSSLIGPLVRDPC